MRQRLSLQTGDEDGGDLGGGGVGHHPLPEAAGHPAGGGLRRCQAGAGRPKQGSPGEELEAAAPCSCLSRRAFRWPCCQPNSTPKQFLWTIPKPVSRNDSLSLSLCSACPQAQLYTGGLPPQQPLPILGGKLHQVFHNVLENLWHIMSGYCLPEPYFSAKVRTGTPFPHL